MGQRTATMTLRGDTCCKATVIIVVAGLLLSSCSTYTAIRARNAARLGVVAPDETAWPFLGFYKDGQFFAQQSSHPINSEGYLKDLQDVAKDFPPLQPLPGLKEDGEETGVTVEGIPEETDGRGGFLRVRIDPQGKMGGGPVLFWTPQVKLELVRHVAARIDKETEARLRTKGVDLWIDALDNRPFEMRARGITFGTPIGFKVKGVDEIVSVILPAIEKYGNATDERGSVFFIYNLKSGTILFSSFGHPEWSPQAHAVLSVTPRLFFRIEGDPRVYFAAECSLGSGHKGYALFDFINGIPLLKTF